MSFGIVGISSSRPRISAIRKLFIFPFPESSSILCLSVSSFFLLFSALVVLLDAICFALASLAAQDLPLLLISTDDLSAAAALYK